MDEDNYCPKCGEWIEVEFNDSHTSAVDRYTAHCRCTAEADKQAKQENAFRERYDLRGGGARDRTFVRPTLGDLLRKKAQKGSA